MDNKEFEGWFPSTIGSQVEVFYWSASEIILPIIIVAWATFTHQFKMAAVLLIAYCWLYGKYKRLFPKGFAQNLLYFFGLLKYKNYPLYFASRFEE